MLTLYDRPERAARPPLLLSIALHVAGVAILATFGGRVAKPLARHVSTILIAPSSRVTEPKPLKPLPRKILLAPKAELAMKTVTPRPMPEIPVAPAPKIEPRPAVASAPVVHRPPMVSEQPAREPAKPTGFDRPAPPVPAAAPARPASGPVFASTATQTATQTAKAAQIGAFETAGGSGEQASKRVVLAQAGGFGDVANAVTSRARTVTHVGGFGSEAVAANAPAASRNVATGNFGAVASATRSTPGAKEQAHGAAASTPVEIISKPKPVYTEEARRLQIEGEVLVEAQFSASGEIEIRRVLGGLGYGLDQSAMAAARAIRFRPATQNGIPVSTTAVVHISFQLAF